MAHNHRISARTRARSRAVDTLFEAQMRGFASDPESLRGLIAKRQTVSTHPSPLPAYAVTIATGVADHIDRIDEVLATYSHAWALDRMPSTDLAVLRVAVWEILFNEDVPDTVAINEAILLTRRIGTDKSPGFINGLLDAIRRDKYVADSPLAVLSREVAAGNGEATPDDAEPASTDEATPGGESAPAGSSDAD